MPSLKVPTHPPLCISSRADEAAATAVALLLRPAAVRDCRCAPTLVLSAVAAMCRPLCETAAVHRLC